MSIHSEYDIVIFFDTETTGFDPVTCEITEFAYQMFKKGEFVSSDDVFFKLPSGHHVPQRVTEITGISDKLLEDQGINQKEFFVTKFLSKIPTGSHVLVIAHNAVFDMRFLYHTLLKNNIPFPIHWDVLDTLTMFRDRAEYPHKLSDAINFYRIINKTNSHRAIDDVEALIAVFEAMVKDRDDAMKYVNLIGYNPRYPINPNGEFPRIRFAPQELKPGKYTLYQKTSS